MSKLRETKIMTHFYIKYYTAVILCCGKHYFTREDASKY